MQRNIKDLILSSIIIALGFTKTNCSEDIKCIDIDYKNTMTDTDVGFCENKKKPIFTES